MYVKNYEDGDEKLIIPLLREVFGEQQTLEHWQWRYKENPSGFYKNIWLMMDRGRVVGHYAIIPQRMMIQGKEYLCAQSLGTATHTDYRRRGIFETLANKTYQHAAKEHNILIVYGFAVEASYYGLVRKLGWRKFFPIKRLVRILDADAFFKGKSKVKKIFFKAYSRLRKAKEREEYTYNVEKVNRYREDCDDFLDKVSKRFQVMTVRDSRYLNWRFFQRPERSYVNFVCKNNEGRILGYLVLRQHDNIGHIIDLLTIEDKDAIEDLIKKAFDFFRNKSAVAIYYGLPPHNPYYEVFRAHGFIDRGAPGFTYQFIAKINIQNQITSIFNAIDDSKWFITHGDRDTA